MQNGSNSILNLECVCGGGVGPVPAVQYKTKTLCCYGLPIISSLSTSSTGVIFVSASTGFGNVSILSASIWASSIGESPNSPKTYLFFFYKNHYFSHIYFLPFQSLLFNYVLCFLMTKIYFCIRIKPHVLCIPCVELNTWSSRILSRFVSIFTFNQHRIRWNVNDNTNIWWWWNLQMNFLWNENQANFPATCKFHTGTYA